MKYELVSTSVQVKGKVFLKRNKPVLSDADFDPVMLDSLYKQGFIKPVGTKANNPKEVTEQYLTEKNVQKTEPKKEPEKVEETKKVEKPKAKKE